MAYRIAYSREVGRQVGSLPGHIKALAKQEIAGLSNDPRPPQGKELTGHPTYFRLWLGRDYPLVGAPSLLPPLTRRPAVSGGFSGAPEHLKKNTNTKNKATRNEIKKRQ